MIQCSFCNKDRHAVAKLWQGQQAVGYAPVVVFICNECVATAFKAQLESGLSSLADVQERDLSA